MISGPVFPVYERLPDHVGLVYRSKLVSLSEMAEEAAVVYAASIHHFEKMKPVRMIENVCTMWRKKRFKSLKI